MFAVCCVLWASVSVRAESFWCYNYAVRVFRVVLIVVGVLCFVLGIVRLNIRESDPSATILAGSSGGISCGSVLQGKSHDDSNASIDGCAQQRHNDTVAAVALLIIGVVSLGFGIGHIVYANRREMFPQP
jgi:hypothetical protein